MFDWPAVRWLRLSRICNPPLLLVSPVLQLPKIFELVGLGYSAWFTYRCAPPLRLLCMLRCLEGCGACSCRLGDLAWVAAQPGDAGTFVAPIVH